MTSENFDTLLEMVEDKIRKQNTVMRMAILPRTKLEVTLRYLATGDSFKTLEYLFRIPQCSISKLIPQILDAIAEVLKPYIQVSLLIYLFIKYFQKVCQEQIKFFTNYILQQARGMKKIN